jgi:hypothetical protein
MRELERLGEIGKRKHDEQHRHNGEKPSKRRASGLRRFICHAPDANRVRN